MKVLDSFNYLFYDLIKLIYNTKIIYRHELEFTVEDMGQGYMEFDGYQWTLKIKEIFRSTSHEDFSIKIKTCTDQIKESIKKDRIELSDFFAPFIRELENEIEIFKKIINLEIKISELIELNKIKLIYEGKLPVSQHDFDPYEDEKQLAFKKKNHNESDFDHIQELTLIFFEIAIDELSKLILFFKHELNLVLAQQEKLIHQKGEEELMDLIWDGELKQLFKKLKGHSRYSTDVDILHLSCKFSHFEKEKMRDVISKKDYDLHLSKIIDSLIYIILK